MKAKQTLFTEQISTSLDLSLVKIERPEPRPLWRKILDFLTAPASDLSFEEWQHIEQRRMRPSDFQRRGY